MSEAERESPEIHSPFIVLLGVFVELSAVIVG